jgi:RNA polymerase sigma-70 factor (ECF subfamily)
VETESVAKQHSDPGHRFDPLFQAHYDAIYRYCARRLGVSEAEDAAADVFAVAWRRLDDIPDGSDRAWLFGVAYRLIGNRYRSRRRQIGLTTRLRAVPGGAVASGPDPDQTRDEEVDLLLRALDQLSPVDRELLRLSAWDGLDRGEIALVLGISENAVDQRLHRARSRLKTRFSRLQSALSSIEPKEAST